MFSQKCYNEAKRNEVKGMSDSPLMVKSKAFGCKPRYGSSPDCDEADAGSQNREELEVQTFRN